MTTDWNAIAAAVTAHFALTGAWVPYEEILGKAAAPAAPPASLGLPWAVGGGETASPPVLPALDPAAGTPPQPSTSGGPVQDLMPLMVHTFGHADLSVPGQITITSYESEGWVGASANSGAMVRPAGPDAGFGYGVYSFTLSTNGSATGDYALLWPASDGWPGPELDVIELDFDGQPYSSIHWDDAGANAYASHALDAFSFDPYGVHTYAMRWEPGRITVSVDGIEQYTTTDHVPADYAHGGQNAVPGVGMQTWWSIGEQVGDNTVTLYEASYSPLG